MTTTMRYQVSALLLGVLIFGGASAMAQDLFEPLPMISADGKEVLSLSCTRSADGAVLECARSKVIIATSGRDCVVGNRLTKVTLVRARPGLWEANLPVRVDRLRCDGELCSFEEAEKLDAAHPTPPTTRYRTISSPAPLSCSSIRFDVF